MRKGDDTRPEPIDTNEQHDPGSGLRSDGEPFYTLTRVLVVSAGLWLRSEWWFGSLVVSELNAP